MEKQVYPFIDPRIERYCEEIASAESAKLTLIDRQTHLKFVKPQMICGNWQGTLLKILSLLIKPKMILEIGTFTGYATVCLSEGMLGEGTIHTIEVDKEKADFLHQTFIANDLQDRIKLHIGDALSVIPTINEQFDIIFIDADKASYPQYYKLCKDKLNKGGVLLADNILWYGKVALAENDKDKQTNAIKKFNKAISDDGDFDQVILPIRDGLMIARKK